MTFKHLALHLCLGLCQWFPNLVTYCKHLGMFFKNPNAWLLSPDVSIWGTNQYQGFSKASTSNSNVKPDVGTTGLHTHVLRRKAGWRMQGTYYVLSTGDSGDKKEVLASEKPERKSRMSWKNQDPEV